MKNRICFFVCWLIVALWVTNAKATPIRFARSGQKVTVTLANNTRPSESPSLFAFGKRLEVPLAIHDNTVEFVVPYVRVPVVFRIMAGSNASICHEEIVAYPNQPAAWEEDVQLVAVGCPDWFKSWADAVALPVENFQDIKSLRAGHWRASEKAGLLIMGSKAAGKDLNTVFKLGEEYHVNVLVLERGWQNNYTMSDQEITLSTEQMRGPLADLQEQNWGHPPVLDQRTVRIANRQTWIAGPEHPLAEEIRSNQAGTESLRIVLSYLPWQRQLGRTEVADALFLRLLAETAKGAEDRPPLEGHWLLLYPAAKDVKADERPVLASAMKSEKTNQDLDSELQATSLYVLDLRSKKPLSSGALADSIDIESIKSHITEQSPLLILGDHPILDTWKWLKLDRSKHRSRRPGVIWWPNYALPPSIDAQFDIMGLFTEQDIFLEDLSKETKNGN